MYKGHGYQLVIYERNLRGANHLASLSLSLLPSVFWYEVTSVFDYGLNCGEIYHHAIARNNGFAEKLKSLPFNKGAVERYGILIVLRVKIQSP